MDCSLAYPVAGIPCMLIWWWMGLIISLSFFKLLFFFLLFLSFPHISFGQLSYMCLFLWYFLQLYQWSAKVNLLCSWQDEGGNSVPLFCSCGTPPGVLHPALGPPTQEGNGSAGAQQEEKDQKDMFMVIAWEFARKHISHLGPPSGTTTTKKFHFRIIW